MSDHASPPPPAPSPQQEAPEADVQVKEEESTTSPLPVAQTNTNADAPSHPPTRVVRGRESQRLALLQNDPQAQEVEPQKVFCRDCQKWIRLSSLTNYSAANWEIHKMRCPSHVRRAPSRRSFSPSSRVATTERRIALLNDPQVKVCLPRQVQCGACTSKVALGGEVDYDLTDWIEHKDKIVPAPITPQGSASHRSPVAPPPSASSAHSRASAGVSPRTPTPEDSVETTAVAESSPAAVKRGTKRDREEEEGNEEAAEEERPTHRPRTDTESGRAGEGAGKFGWFMQPLKEFARGFREGLGTA